MQQWNPISQSYEDADIKVTSHSDIDMQIDSLLAPVKGDHKKLSSQGLIEYAHLLLDSTEILMLKMKQNAERIIRQKRNKQ